MPVRRFASLLLTALGTTAHAQESALRQSVTVGAAAMTTSHPRLRGVLSGYEFGTSVEVPRANGLHIRVAVQRTTGSDTRLGTLLVGLVPPDADTTPVPLRDHSRLTSVQLSAIQPLVSWRSLFIDAGVVLTVAQAQSGTTRATDSNQRLSASKAIRGIGVQAGAVWIPVPRFPVGVFVNGQLGGMGPFVQDRVADGYTPLNDGFTLRQLSAGLFLRLSPP